jgi:hypothetical protein
MKYSLECKVDSKLLIGNALNVAEGTKEYILTPDNNGFLASIKIITKVDNPEKFYSKIEQGNEKVKLAITVESDETIANDLKSDFQYLESSLAFAGNLKKIYWEEAKQEWIPETEEEKSKLKVFAFSFSRKYPDSPTKITKNDFVQIIKGKSKYDCLTTLKSFYREGKNSFDRFQYVNAFYNFYFVIEDLFGGGKTKNKQIEESYQSSDELKEIIKWATDTHIKTSEEHSKGISKFLKELRLQDTTEDIIRLLVRMRGRVHHYTSKSSLEQVTPLSQGDFASISFLIMAIALMSILRETVKINRRKGQ